MSVEAYTWALNLAPVPLDADRRGQSKPNSACAFVLVGLANNAKSDGTLACPSVRTLMRYTRLSERTVRTALDRLEEEGVIVRCDPAIVAAIIKRKDRRTTGYDLVMDRIRNDLTGQEFDDISRQYPWLRPWIEQRHDRVDHRNKPVDNRSVRGATVAPRTERGATHARNGVQPTQPRGAAAAPEPYLEPYLEPSNAAAVSPEPEQDCPQATPPPLPPAVTELRRRLEAVHLIVRWDKLDPNHLFSNSFWDTIMTKVDPKTGAALSSGAEIGRAHV